MTSPKLATTTARGRLYTHPATGEQYPSVTTILNVVGKGDALKHWAASEVAKYAVKNKASWLTLDDQAAVDLLKREPLRSLDRAASRGTDVHAIAEAYARTGTLPVWADEIGGYVEALRLFFAEYQPTPVLIEATVFNPVVQYAGSFDMVCKLPQFGDDLVILDYKTSKAIYPEVAAQLSAYAFAQQYIDESGTVQPMPEIKRGVAVRFAIDGTYEVIECDIEKGWQYFQAVRAVHNLPPKPLLIGRMNTPLIDPAARDEKADNLRKRINYIKDNHQEALQQLLLLWSPTMPTFKSDHVHTMQQLNEINMLITQIEADHTVPFMHTQPKRPPAAKTPPAAAVEPALPSDDLLVSEDHVHKLRERLNNSNRNVQDTARALAKEASAARRSISLSGKPSIRRALLVELMLDALQQTNGTTELLDQAIDKLGYRNSNTLGASLGALDIEQITKMSELLTSGTATTTTTETGE